MGPSRALTPVIADVPRPCGNCRIEMSLDMYWIQVPSAASREPADMEPGTKPDMRAYLSIAPAPLDMREYLLMSTPNRIVGAPAAAAADGRPRTTLVVPAVHAVRPVVGAGVHADVKAMVVGA